MSQFNEFVSFVRNLYSTSDFLPLHVPIFNGNEKKYILETIESTFVSSVGAYVNRIEEIMRAHSSVNRAVATVNGTTALDMALKVCGVGQNDEVITQALTFVATANAISYNGAIPVFVDVDYDTMGLSPKALLHFLETHATVENGVCKNKKTGRRIAACMPMHTFGFMCRIDEIASICDEWSIVLIEDTAEAIGSKYKGRPSGNFGRVGAFSFNGNKVVTAGGGGMMVTNDEKIADLAKHLTTTAKVPHKWDYFHDQIGYNFRMPNLNAALLCAQMEQLDKFIINKRETALEYKSFFDSMGITFRMELEDCYANYWLMCIELDNQRERDEFLAKTNDAGVMTRPIWKLMFDLPMFKDCYRDSQENASLLSERIVNIPSSFRPKL
ncbi:MAG: aminotransferase DegT [Cytophagales bacterium CG12_big_fil_rev_8_21_14_0_65_40_12]|nr:MAG: aminotransferase DegT [Cytophagales bacterium CG12_big_fil_rev_8_21_14_0_65_40_12]PIW04248.1 MAG: aminotransferase DegT [Cytophagales bacterium CG17_big_fil_post_rev_8_21_14_2_50_40_13]